MKNKIKNNLKLKPLVALGLCAVVLNPMTTQASTTEYINSTGSVYDSETIGRDETQNKSTEYTNAVTNSSESTFSKTSDVSMYCTKKSMLSVRVPVVLPVDSETLVAEGKIVPIGDIAGDQTLNVSVPSSINFSEVAGQKNTIDGSLSLSKNSWNHSDLGTPSKITAKMNSIKAGSWYSTASIGIELQRP